MRLENEFTVPVPLPQAWKALLDVQRVAPCIPGATVDRVENDEVVGRVKVALGPLTVSYAGTTRFVEKDEGAHRLVLEARGRETRGSGTAAATIEARLREEGSSARVTVVTDLQVTGKPAQFGRSVMVDIAAKLMDQFAACVADQVRGPAAAELPPGERVTAPETGPGGPSSAQAEPSTWSAAKASEAAFDLIGAVGPPMVKRVAPVLLGAAVGMILGRLLSRRPRIVMNISTGTPEGNPSPTEGSLTMHSPGAVSS
jgi:carbon monoxide dehydrogenase subunit G